MYTWLHRRYILSLSSGPPLRPELPNARLPLLRNITHSGAAPQSRSIARTGFQSSTLRTTSSLASNSAAVVVGICATLAFGFALSVQQLDGGKVGRHGGFETKKTVPVVPQLKSNRSLAADIAPDMSSTPQPERPGSLTPEQESRLREFWQATLQIFGTWEPPLDTTNGTSPMQPDQGPTHVPSEGAVGGAGKKRKSRLSLFGRRHRESGKEADSELETTSFPDEDDKHGLNKVFREALAQNSPEDLRKAFWNMVKHDNPDDLLLRFLRARKWNVQQALVMLVSTMHWRSEEMHVDDDVVRWGEGGAAQASKSADPRTRKDGEDFMTQFRMGKSFLHGVDKEGRPMCLVRVRLHKQGEQSESSLERFTVYTIETARLMLRPPVDTAVGSGMDHHINSKH